MAVVTFDGVGKIYPDGTRALSDFSLEIGDGEFMVFVGPSGCGKTTALRMLAGLEEITEGEVRIDGKTINTLDPRKRDVAMVFQNYALYPHMTIYQNIAFPLENAGMKKDEIRRRVEQTAKLLDLGDMLKRRPRALSGGQRQRVAMGRAIVREPSVFLMDEPLSNLDAKLRVQMRAEITSLQRSLGVTTVYVTHDQTEAMTMGNRIVVLRKGELQQVGPPQELYDSPTNLFVASFVGSPAMNLFEGRLERDETSGSVVCVIGEQRLLIGDELLRERPALGERLLGRTVAVGIRPEHLPCVDGAYSGPTLAAQVVNVEALGFERFVHAEIAAQPVMTDAIIEIAEDTDAAILQTLEHEAGSRRTPVVSRVSGDIRVAIGEPVRLQVDHRHLHFFEIATGLTL